uniref:Uncharacterized protein n=1 Tax=Colletotrichum fructicola (strain Nara gc5) TaxID=1213859 RepID=L2G390_COLFN
MSQRNWAEKPSGYEPARVYDVEDEPAGPDTIVYKRYSFFSCTEWVLEIVTSIGSLVILAAVAAIFATVDGHPLSDWTFPISLNAVISILTTACSAAIMHGVSTFISQLKWLHFKNGPQKLEHLERFDEASRGPLGSLKFLVSMKWNLATIGALVTIFRLALSPLAQQVVKIEERVVYKNDTNVTLGYTHTYNRPLDYPDLRGVPQDPNMQAAILQGLYNISIPATFACPLTCEWQDTYVTLGFTSECRNVTQQTLQTRTCETTSNEACNMTTPWNIGLSTQKVHTASGTSFYMNASVAEDEFPEIARFGIYRATSDGGFNQYDMNITECSLSLAAYKYTGARSEGTSFGFTKTEMIELSGNRTGPPSERGNIFTGITLTKANDLPPFYMSTYELGALRQFFMSEAIVTKWVDGYRADLGNKVSGLSASALSGDVDIGKRFQKMAISMTDYLRSGPNSVLAEGKRVEQVSHVSIRWWFFAGPAAIEALALLFAVLTIFSNRKNSGVPLWKSSALAVLACEHEKKSELLKTTVKDIKKIEKLAETSFVKLE